MPSDQQYLRFQMLIAGLTFWVLGRLIELCDWGRGRWRSLLLVMALGATPYLVHLVRRCEIVGAAGATKALAVLCAGLLCWHVVYFARYVGPAPVIGIATTTVEAGEAMLAGKNPYRLPIDPQPQFADQIFTYDGYKYLPMMPLTYMPLGMAWRERGLLATNLVLDFALAALVFLLGSRIGTTESGLYATVLWLALPMVLYEVFQQGVTDFSAMLPLLAALLCVETKPLIAGVLVGLSISTKLLPGLVFVPCCLPHRHRGRYLVGLVLGVVPVLVFVALSPLEVISNIVLFVLKRPPDSTTWLYELPPWVGKIGLIAFVATVAGLGAYVWWRRPGLPERCGAAAVCVLAALLTGSVCHRNYQLWWIPLFAVLLAAAAFRRRAEATPPRQSP